MELKKTKEFVYNGFGFPVRLRDVTLVKVWDVWTPKIDYNKLAAWVLLTLSRAARPLTGNEIRYIRHHFEMTLQDFAKRFDVTHQAVMKWEQKKDHSTAMSWSMEKDIRLFIQSKLSPKAEKLGELYEELTMTLAERKEAGKPGLGPVKVATMWQELAESK